MKFDLLDAMAHMRQNFGTSGEILLRQNHLGFLIRLQVFHPKGRFYDEFHIPLIEITDCNVNIMNWKFKDAIERLKKLINA